MRIHCISVGGVIMHQLAIALKLQGHEVTGSDDEIFDPAYSNLLQHQIISPSYQYHPDHVTEDIDLIILGMHAQLDNPELLKAQALNIPIMSFPEFIAQHAQNKTRIVVAGSHGKTTTTAMIMHLLQRVSLPFDYLVGAQVPGFPSTVKLSSDAPFMVFEGDEYYSSRIDPQPKFNWYKPHIAILTGIAWDHINVYPTFDSYINTFANFIQRIDKNGYLIYYEKDPIVTKLVAEYGNSVHTIPYSQIPYTYEGDNSYVLYNDLKIPVRFFGTHNFTNLAAVLQVGKILGITEESFFAAMSDFQLPSRRLECIVNRPPLMVYRDFAHAPTKVQATIQALREKYPSSKIIAILELHTYSSKQESYLPQYAHTMDEATQGIIYISQQSFAQRNRNMISTEEIRRFFKRNDLLLATKPEELNELIKKIMTEENDQILLFMSAGNFDHVDLLEFFKVNL